MPHTSAESRIETDVRSDDIALRLAEQLRAIAPEAFTETGVDFETLRLMLGDAVDDSSEKYGFSWSGKRQARQLAQTPTSNTLRPVPQESSDWEQTKNIFVDGDNLEVLKLLQKSYHKQVKMIYIDPPYNTGNEFVYQDKFQEGLERYHLNSGQLDATGAKLSTNSESSGRYHTNWLNMIFPRLKLARNLLSADGLIVMSIDDHEVTNLRRVADEIFGEENFVAQLVWAAGRKNDSKLISVSHEYMLVYVRDKETLRKSNTTWRVRKKGLEKVLSIYDKVSQQHGSDYAAVSREMKQWYNSLPASDASKRHQHYCQVDERGLYFPDNISWPGGGGPTYSVLHPRTNRPCKVPSRGWMFADPKRMQAAIDQGRVHFGIDEKSVPCMKSYLADHHNEVLYSVFYQDGRAATKRLRNLLEGDVFDHPKDETVLADIIEACTGDGDLVLDFFAGSGSLAHASLLVDARQATNRQFILVQLPEPCDPKTKTGKQAISLGYRTIAELAKERLRRAAVEVQKKATHNIDGGFRVYRLDTSNFSDWDPATEDLQESLLSAENSIKQDRSEMDVVCELSLKLGIPLSAKIRTLQLTNGSVLYSIADGELIVCLSEPIDTEEIEAISQLHKNVGNSHVILRDNGFVDDTAKTNALQILKQAGVNEVRCL